jgi:hypothetical protein
MLLACFGSGGASVHLRHDRPCDSVMRECQEPLHCPSLRATEFSRLIVTLKSNSASYVVESAEVTYGAMPTEAVSSAKCRAPAATLQSQSVRLQV